MNFYLIELVHNPKSFICTSIKIISVTFWYVDGHISVSLRFELILYQLKCYIIGLSIGPRNFIFLNEIYNTLKLFLNI